MIQLETLGAVDLRRDGTDVRSVLSQPKRLALLVYLATASPRGFQSRDRLLGLFWPESDEERARNALRQSLHYLRRSLGEAAITSRGDREVGVDPGEVRCDAVAFEEALAAGRPREALDHYRDEFLAGLYVEDAPEVERWIEEQRARYRRAAVEAAKAAADAEEARGDVRAAALMARRGLAIEPHDEAGLRRLLDLLERVGERAEALQTYEEFARRFDEELGLAVSDETRATVERIRTGGSTPSADAAALPSSGRPAASPSGPITPAAPSTTVARSRSSTYPSRMRRLRLRPRIALVIGGVLLALGVVAGLLIARTRGMVAPAAAASPPAIAVLPFANMSNDPAHELYSDGLAEELMTALARVPGLRVVARTSAFSFKGRPVGVDSIARALRVEHVLEGSVRIDGGRLRVTAKLVDASSGYQVWADTYDADLSDAFAVQDEIARAIVAALEPNLSGPRAPAVAGTRDPQAHADLLRGLAALRLDAAEWFPRADTFFRRAIARDSSYAQAWAGLARVRVVDAYRRVVPPVEGYAEAKSLAERALALDPTIATAHVVLGRVAEEHAWDFAAAERHYRRALAIAPVDEPALRQLGRLLAHLGRTEESIELSSRALELDPIAPIAYRWLGASLTLTGQYDRAIQVLETAIATSPENELAHLVIAVPLTQLGRHDEAVAAAEHAVARGPGEQLFLAFAAWANARAGRTDRASELLARLEATPRPAFYYRAMVHAGLGNADRAFEMLDRAITEREAFLPQVGSQPAFASLRGDARFADVLRSVGLQR